MLAMSCVFKLDNCALEAAADGAVVESAGNAVSIQHPGPHLAACALLRCQAFDPALRKRSAAEGFQNRHLQQVAMCCQYKGACENCVILLLPHRPA